MIFLNLPYGICDIIEFLVGHGWMERKPYPAWLVRKITKIDLLCNLIRLIVTHIQQKVTVCSGAGTSASYLNTKFVIQQF